MAAGGEPQDLHGEQDPRKVYTRDEAARLAADRGWVVKADGAGWRRVVGSPRPQRVVETRLIRLLLESGAVVVCAGGGGVPVVRDTEGLLRGVEAVVDKDLTSAVLAEALDADLLLVLTDVPAVMEHFGTPDQQPIPAPPRADSGLSNRPPVRWDPRSTRCAGSSS